LQSYDQDIAKHYSAYRPPLHKLILREVLADQHFETGLDFGCGTGRSSSALLHYCDHVVGLDNSNHMLRQAPRNPKIAYRLLDGPDWPVQDKSIDVVTLAGVLPYLNVNQTVDEMRRVCRSKALIIPYDFEVQIDPILLALSIAPPPNNSGYDHSRNLSRNRFLSTLAVETRILEVSAKPEEAAHVLLADSDTHKVLEDTFGAADLFSRIACELGQSSWRCILEAKVFFAVHSFTCAR